MGSSASENRRPQTPRVLSPHCARASPHTSGSATRVASASREPTRRLADGQYLALLKVTRLTPRAAISSRQAPGCSRGDAELLGGRSFTIHGAAPRSPAPSIGPWIPKVSPQWEDGRMEERSGMGDPGPDMGGPRPKPKTQSSPSNSPFLPQTARAGRILSQGVYTVRFGSAVGDCALRGDRAGTVPTGQVTTRPGPHAEASHPRFLGAMQPP